MALSGGAVGLTQAQDTGGGPDVRGTYALKSDSGAHQAMVEIRDCGKDMCVYVKKASPSFQSQLGIPADASDYEVVSGLKADGNGGLEDGKLKASGMADGASVKVSPAAGGKYQMVASKMFKSVKGELEKAPTQLASAAKAPMPKGPA